MRRIRIGMALMFVATGLMSGLAQTAQASTTNVVTAIRAQDKIIRHTPGFAELSGKGKAPTTPAGVKRFVADIGRLEKVSAHAVDVVSRSSTTSTRQHAGKIDWVKGSREQNRGLLKLQAAFRALIAHNKTAFKHDYVSAIKQLAAGSKLGAKGDKLLGLPPSD